MTVWWLTQFFTHDRYYINIYYRSQISFNSIEFWDLQIRKPWRNNYTSIWMIILDVNRVLDLKCILTETFKVIRTCVDFVDVLTYITRNSWPHHKGNPILSTGNREVNTIHWAYISMWEVASKQININKSPLKERTIGGTIKGKRNLF